MKRVSPFETACLLLIGVAILFRVYAFARLPGFNGDEAWYGVQALRWADGAHVNWRTPTGNLVSPMQLGALRLLHSIFDPAPWLLRFPTLVTGILAIPLTGLVGWRAFGRRAGFLAALLCAVIPANIIHSRFGWDPSHLVLFAALATWGAVQRNLLLVVLPFAFGLWVHPTQVFLAPFLVLTFLGASLAKVPRVWALGMTAVALAALGFCTYALSVITSGGGQRAPLSDVLTRLGSLETWLKQTVVLARFFLGDTSYEYISGARFPGPEAAWVAGFWALLLALLGFGVWRLVRAKGWLALGMVSGALASHVAFYLLAGPHMLAPHVERFGLCLVVPSLFALVALSTAFSRPREEKVGAAGFAVVALLLLVGFCRSYFVTLMQTGSEAHETFWTGPREPKVAAVERILSLRRPGAPLVIITQSWWTSWLTAYLLAREPDAAHAARPAPFYSSKTDVFLMGFPGGVEETWAKRLEATGAVERIEIPGYARDAAIVIWRPK